MSARAAIAIVGALVIQGVAGVERAAPFVGLARRAIAVDTAIAVHAAIERCRAIIRRHTVGWLATLANRPIAAVCVGEAGVVAAGKTENGACLDAAAIGALRGVRAVGVVIALAVRTRRAVRGDAAAFTGLDVRRARVRAGECSRAVFFGHAVWVWMRAAARAEQHHRRAMDLPARARVADCRQRARQIAVPGTAQTRRRTSGSLAGLGAVVRTASGAACARGACSAAARATLPAPPLPAPPLPVLDEPPPALAVPSSLRDRPPHATSSNAQKIQPPRCIMFALA